MLNETSIDSLPELISNNSRDIEFFSLMEEVSVLKRLIVQNQYLNTSAQVMLKEIQAHEMFWLQRHMDGWYYADKDAERRAQEFSTIDDRGGLSTIFGMIGEWYVAYRMIGLGHNVEFERTKEGQCQRGIDLYLSKVGWRYPISAQVKRIRCYDHVYGYFSKKPEWIAQWFQSNATRLVFLDETFLFWVDSLLFKKVIYDDNGELVVDPNKLSLQTFFDLMSKRYPKYENIRFQLLSKL